MVDLVEKVYLYLILDTLVQNCISKNAVGGHFGLSNLVLLFRLTPAYGSHLDNRVNVKFNSTNTVRIRIVMVDLVKKVY